MGADKNKAGGQEPYANLSDEDLHRIADRDWRRAVLGVSLLFVLVWVVVWLTIAGQYNNGDAGAPAKWRERPTTANISGALKHD